MFLVLSHSGMEKKIETVKQYLDSVSAERLPYMKKLRNVIKKNIPKGFKEGINYGMIGYFVPHSIYPEGYHAKPEDPLPFINIASQKNYIALYHAGIYSDKKLLKWFTEEYPKHCKRKLDMGKSCIRFKKPDDIPFALIEQLASKITVEDWINTYEKAIKK